uniref:Parasite pepsinogen n=2 Tax=Haemonchus contortus TaxID=6289 RepID=Q25037_HAECO|nr:parasite pepsinogen [Haemonchus contortus]
MLYLLLLVSYVVAGSIYQTPLVKIESMRMEMIRKGTWAEFVKKKNAMRASLVSNANQTVFPHPIYDYQDTEYLAKITIGAPGQSFHVVLDTGSANLWIPDNICVNGRRGACRITTCDRGLVCEVLCHDKSCCEDDVDNPDEDNPCKGKSGFDSTQSTSYAKITPKKYFEIVYGTGFAKGFLGNDTVRFGEEGNNKTLVVPGTVFGQAVQIGDPFANNPINGILGLGFRGLAQAGVTPPLQRAIDLKLVDPIFTVYMKQLGAKAKGQDGGAFTYGGLDSVNCGQEIAYVDLTRPLYWQFKMEAFSAGYLSIRKGWEVISDTGTSFMGVPTAIADLVADSYGGQYDEMFEIYTVDCNATVTFGMTIGGKQYKIERKNLVLEEDKDSCMIAMTPLSSVGFGPQWILGAPFIRQYCNIHDMRNNTIGFAEPK